MKRVKTVYHVEIFLQYSCWAYRLLGVRSFFVYTTNHHTWKRHGYTLAIMSNWKTSKSLLSGTELRLSLTRQYSISSIDYSWMFSHYGTILPNLFDKAKLLNTPFEVRSTLFWPRMGMLENTWSLGMQPFPLTSPPLAWVLTKQFADHWILSLSLAGFHMKITF